MADRDREPPHDGDDAGESLPAGVADVLAGWAAGDPPAGFVDRVVAAARKAPPSRAGDPEDQLAAKRRRWRLPAALAVAVTAVAAVLLVLGRGSTDEGARITQQRETIALGRRGVAVAEPGAELTWAIAARGDAAIHQTRGDVFYRVERGGPFVVETPYGRIEVRGTCFRVEVLNMQMSKQAWLGGTVGAALAATIVIAVYEGGVRVVNAHGNAEARAGERIALAPGTAPAKLGAGAVAAVEPPPPDSATIAELRQRDQAHRGEIALLRQRLVALEAGASAGAAKPVDDARRGRWRIIDLSPDELAQMAKDCELRFDVPGYGLEPKPMNDKLAASAGLSADERAAYDRTARGESERYMTALRALYREIGGDGGDNLDAHSLAMEIMQKSPAADVAAAHKRLADERAGLAQPPASTSGESVVERLFRLESAAGGSLEQLLAAELGPDKAHQLRLTGWPGNDDNILSGCPD